MAIYSSREAARMLGLSPSAMSKYVLSRKIPIPQSVTTGGITVYLWTREEIEHVRKLLPKIANGRKTRYKKKQSAVSSQQSAKPKKQKAKRKSKPRKA